MWKRLKRLAAALVFLICGAVVADWHAFGGGAPYGDLTTAPTLPEGTIKAVGSKR